MTPAKQPADLPDNLPLLTEVVGAGVLDDFPTLTEIATEFGADTGRCVTAPEMALPHSDAIGEEQIQKLLQQLEAHLETIFKQKLNLRIEQLQQQAIGQAVDELKAALPELLRDALPANFHNDN